MSDLSPGDGRSPARSQCTDRSMLALFETQRQASREAIDVPLEIRRDRLRRLSAMADAHSTALSAAVEADFGVRSPALTAVADLFVLHNLMRQLSKNLARWSRPQRVGTPIYLQPARACVQRQPLGVVGVISPWNYPLQLSLGPAATALAAGNRVMLKPSELTPHTSELLARLVAASFSQDEFAVVTGDAELASAFSALPFDHLFFTGSTAVGRKVALAAAANLTPVTLELGGKSPCIVDASADLDTAALRIAHGKLLNAGQTCIAPDYLLLPRGCEDAFAAAWKRAVARLFPHISGNPDYAAILTGPHLVRLQSMLDEARASGARVEQTAAQRGPANVRQMAPALVFGVQPEARLLHEEIFGPLLPVLTYEGIEDAVRYVNARPRPLALYWFGTDTAKRDRVLRQTVSGGVAVNDTLLHIAHDNLPFGGVGDSGIGSYHGESGFLRFTHQKAVLVQSRWSGGALLYPPYGARLGRMMKVLRILG